MRWWTNNLTKTSLLSSDDGNVVFYPFGPFKGFVVPKPAFHPVIIGALKRIFIFSLGTTLATMFIGAAFGFGVATMTAVGLLDFVLYTMLIQRLTRYMAPLPFWFAFRFYARRCDEQRLWERFLGTLLLAPAAIFLLFANNVFMAVLCLTMFGPMSLVYGILLTIRYRESKSVTG